MSSALEAFRAQKEAVDQVHARLTEVAALVRGVQVQVDAIAEDQGLRTFLRDEQTLLERAERTVQEVRAFREFEMRRFWPGMWRRWALALVFALASAAVFGSGYVWASRPYEAELASLRLRTEAMDSVAQRLLTMTPAERRQFYALMQWRPAPRQ